MTVGKDRRKEEETVNTQSNGAIAVGAPGSWARFASAYEHELYKAIEKDPMGYITPLDRTAIAALAHKMMVSASKGSANVSPVMKRAAKAVGANPTISGIMAYLKATGVSN